MLGADRTGDDLLGDVGDRVELFGLADLAAGGALALTEHGPRPRSRRTRRRFPWEVFSATSTAPRTVPSPLIATPTWASTSRRTVGDHPAAPSRATTAASRRISSTIASTSARAAPPEAGEHGVSGVAASMVTLPPPARCRLAVFEKLDRTPV